MRFKEQVYSRRAFDVSAAVLHPARSVSRDFHHSSKRIIPGIRSNGSLFCFCTGCGYPYPFGFPFVPAGRINRSKRRDPAAFPSTAHPAGTIAGCFDHHIVRFCAVQRANGGTPSKKHKHVSQADKLAKTAHWDSLRFSASARLRFASSSFGTISRKRRVHSAPSS